MQYVARKEEACCCFIIRFFVCRMAWQYASVASSPFLISFLPKVLKGFLAISFFAILILISPKNCASYWWVRNYPREARQSGNPMESNEASIFSAPADHGIICPWLDLAQEGGGISSLACAICCKKCPALKQFCILDHVEESSIISICYFKCSSSIPVPLVTLVYYNQLTSLYQPK